MDNGQAAWIDIDLPEVIDLRSELLDETDRHKMFGASILKEQWIVEVKQYKVHQQEVLILTGGTFMYFEESEFRSEGRN